MQQALERFGRIDVLVNNAGTNAAFGPIAELSHAQFAKTLDVNLWAPILWTSLAWRAAMAERGGVVVNVSSVGGFIAGRDRRRREAGEEDRDRQQEPAAPAPTASRRPGDACDEQLALELAPRSASTPSRPDSCARRWPRRCGSPTSSARAKDAARANRRAARHRKRRQVPRRRRLRVDDRRDDRDRRRAARRERRFDARTAARTVGRDRQFARSAGADEPAGA